MANRFWVGSTSTWDATAGTKWATTSGGAGGAAVPTAADDVFFDASSTGTITTSGTTTDVCRSLNCTGFTGTLSHAASTTITVGDGTAGAGNIALKLVAGMTYTLGSTSTSSFTFVSTSATVQTVDYGGKNGALATFNGAGGSWKLLSGFITTQASGSGVDLVAGSLDTNGQAVTVNGFRLTGTSTRSLTLGASVVDIGTNSGGLGGWNALVTTNLTFNAGTSTIDITAPNNSFQGGGLTYNNVNIVTGSGGTNLTGTNTFANLTMTLSQAGRVSASADQTISTLLTMQQSSATSRGMLQSGTRGTAVTFTAASATISNVHIMDITGAGAASPFVTTNTGDVGGNSNITFAAGVTRYWVAVTGGSFNATSSWSTSSGGASGASVPLPQDTAVFDANSITSSGRTITINSQVVPTLDFTNVLNSPTVTQLITNGQIWLYGSLIYKSGLTVNHTTSVFLAGRSSHTLTSGGVTITGAFQIHAPGGTYTLTDALTMTSGITIAFGGFNSGGFNITISALAMTSTTAICSLTLSTSIVSLTATTATNIVDIRGTSNITYDIASSTLQITTASANQRVLNASLGAITFGSLKYTVANSTGTLVVQSAAHSFNNIEISDGVASRTVQFTTNTTFTIRGNFIMNGVSGFPLTLRSLGAGTQFTLSKSSGIVSCDYLSIQDSNATGGATWYAGANSTNVSNNRGWQFSNQDASKANFFQVM